MDFNYFIGQSSNVTDPLVQYQTLIFAIQTIILIAQLVVFGFQYVAFRDQARTLRETVRVADEQFNAMQQENNKDAFFALLQEINNLHPDPLPSGRDVEIEGAYASRSNVDLEDNAHFLQWFSEQLKGIDEKDRFRRHRLFAGFALLYGVADNSRKQLFRDALCSKIGDELARILILQSVREQDQEMLTIVGKFPMEFENLHRMPTLKKQIVLRFVGEV